MTVGITWKSINSAFCLAVRSLSSGTNFLSSIPGWTSLGLQMTDSRPQTSSETAWDCWAKSPVRKPSTQTCTIGNCWAHSGEELSSFPPESSTLNFLTWLLKYSLIQSLYKYLPFPPVSWSTCVSDEFSVLQSARMLFCLKLHGTKAGKIDQLEKCLLKKPRDLGSKLRTHVKRRWAQ